MIKAYYAAGIVGAYFAQGPGFSAEEHGCQVECGAASGMAAADIVQLMGGTAKQALGAASMAIQNMIGLVCDQVIRLEEVIQTVSRISKTMPTCVKCTGKGGLAITEEAVKLKLKLSQK